MSILLRMDLNFFRRNFESITGAWKTAPIVPGSTVTVPNPPETSTAAPAQTTA